MQYKGKLFGKVAGEYFPLIQTSEDVDNMEKELTRLRSLNEELKAEVENHKKLYRISVDEITERIQLETVLKGRIDRLKSLNEAAEKVIEHYQCHPCSQWWKKINILRDAYESLKGK